MIKMKPLLAGLALALVAVVPLHAQGVGQLGSGQLWGNAGATQARGAPTSVTAILDRALGSTRGAILERGASGWGLIGPGTTGKPFVSNGSGADPAYQTLGIVGGGTGATTLTANAFLTGNGTSPINAVAITGLVIGNGASSPTGYGGVTCTNQFLSALSTIGAGTCTTDVLASAQHANQGTTTTVLHGNAAGNPSWSQVSLSADVTGNLPIANFPIAPSSDMVLGYWSSTSASALSINNCANALTYSTTTHTFGCNSTAGTGTVTTTGSPAAGQLAFFSGATSITGLSVGAVSNALGANVSITNTTSYFDGAVSSQGAATGTFFVIGSCAAFNSNAANNYGFRLWDGTTVIASGLAASSAVNQTISMTLAGIITNPAGSPKISVRNFTNGSGNIQFNGSGDSKDCNITVYRVS